MSTAETTRKPASVSKPAVETKGPDGKREKRTITEIRESKKTGEEMVYMSVPDYTRTMGGDGRRRRSSSW
jgi:hypothetical protein